MNKPNLTFVAFSAFAAFCGLAYAGPEQLSSGKEMKEVAPVPPECPNWTGFYIGGFGAYEYGLIDPGIRAHEDEAIDAREIQSHLGDAFSGAGGEAGGLIGFNYEWHKLVLGFEGAAGHLWLRNSETARYSVGRSDIYEVSESFRTNYLVTVGPRLGYAWCKWLPYATGGVALGDLDFRQSISETDDYHVSRSNDDMNVGWFAGGGLQYELCRHWSVRAQYQYIELGNIGLARYKVPFELQADSRLHLREHNASFAIVYGF